MTRQFLAALVACGVVLGCAKKGIERAASPPPPEPPIPGESDWRSIASAPLAARRHDDLFFLDRTRGWLVNTDGLVYRTTDGGDRWELVATQPSIISARLDS